MEEHGAGARWIRASLQVNPYGYQGKNQPSTSFESEALYNSALLDQCETLGIGLIAITDHWAVDTASGLITDAEARGIVALPGFEANSSEGIHLLVIFEAGTEASTVNAAIGACGVEPGCANGTPGNSFKDILEAMTMRGALVIPAHVNVPSSGMLTGRSGPPLVAMIKHRNLHAIAITPSQAAGTDQDKILRGTKPYDRKHPIAAIFADDIVHPDQLSSPGGSTWFKANQARVESLKLAVRTPETRVATTDPAGTPRALIKSISWTGGFLDQVKLPISSDLTALIGGRGTGKSTVIESLRYAFGLSPIGSEARLSHKSVVDKVLRSGTIVSVEVEAVLPSPRRYTIQRVVPDDPVVLDAAGQPTNQSPSDVIESVEIFGQHELAELAGNPASVASMLRRFSGSVGRDEGHAQCLTDLADNREQLRKAEEARARLESELSDIGRLEEQVQHFDDTDVATRLSAVQRLEKDEANLTEAANRVDASRTALIELLDPQRWLELSAEYEEIENSPQKAIVEKASKATAHLATRMKAFSEEVEAAVSAASEQVAAAKTEWVEAVKDERAAHAAVLRSLHEEGLQPDKYLDTAKALETLKAKRPQLAGHDKQLKELLQRRNELLQALHAYDRSDLETLHEAVRAANAATGGVVIVRPAVTSDRDHISDVIAKYVSGVKTQISAAVASPDVTPGSLAAACRGGADALAAIGIRGAQSANLIAAGEALFRELEELSLGHAVEVLLDVSAADAPTELKAMDSLSKGQRATALLLLLLSTSVAPLVIDQPEDDLDNRFVYDGIVANLRQLKGRRQVIASTHNANVPVLGDAELIIALEGDGSHGRPTNGGVGSLDDSEIRSLVENLLEGGPTAFNARQHLYGF